MYKTTVRERPERQLDRFNVTFKRCSQGYLMTITEISIRDSLEDAHSKAEKAINEICKVMAEENLLKTGLNFKQEKILQTNLKNCKKMQEELEKQAELMGELEARLGLIENKQI